MPIEVASDARDATPGDRINDDLVAAASALATAGRVTIVCHENPDADTLGGGMALAVALESRGVSSEVVCATGWPSTLDFLPGIDRVLPAPAQEPDVIVLVDCASVERAGEAIASWIRTNVAAIVNVDHHRSNPGYGTLACVDHTAAATSEVVARLIRALGVDLEPLAATMLLAGVLHDTDGLKTPSTSPTTLRLAADLVEAGADVGDVSSHLFGRRPVRALRLWGTVLACLESHHGERIVVGTLRDADLAASGSELMEAEDLPDMIATAQHAEVALLMREVGPTRIRVSIRTSASVDASSVAAEFGGGGHERAAGCTVDGPLDDVRRQLVDVCIRHLGGSGGTA